MFHGVFTALITPFIDGDIDEDAFSRLIESQIVAGVQGLVPCGTTGESPTLTHDEHQHLVSLCVEITAGRALVMAGAGSNSTAEAIMFARHAEAVGVDAGLVVTPYYNRPTAGGLLAHYTALHDSVERLPLFIYNIPSRSVIDMDVATMATLARLPRIVGVKDATSDLERVALQAEACGSEFIQFSGEDMTALSFLRLGGAGCISVVSNVAPARSVALYAAVRSGDFARAEALDSELRPLYQALALESNPIPAKYAMAQLGFGDGSLRLPLVSSSAATVRAIDSALSAL